MCVGVTVTLAPPTALAAGYVLWNSGQSIALKRLQIDVDTPPPQTFLSYGVGFATLGGVYLGLDNMIQQMEAKASGSKSSPQINTASSHFLPHKAPQQAFRPPQTVQELIERLGPPLLSRIGAASFSFFCAGIVQTYVANAVQPIQDRRRPY